MVTGTATKTSVTLRTLCCPIGSRAYRAFSLSFPFSPHKKPNLQLVSNAVGLPSLQLSMNLVTDALGLVATEALAVISHDSKLRGELESRPCQHHQHRTDISEINSAIFQLVQLLWDSWLRSRLRSCAEPASAGRSAFDADAALGSPPHSIFPSDFPAIAHLGNQHFRQCFDTFRRKNFSSTRG